MTESDVFIPDRARTYCLSLEATMRTSCGTSPAGLADAAGPSFVASSPRVAQSSRVGETCSSAHASRWRIVGTCAFQQATEQNTKELPLRLHVLTLQIQ